MGIQIQCWLDTKCTLFSQFYYMVILKKCLNFFINSSTSFIKYYKCLYIFPLPFLLLNTLSYSLLQPTSFDLFLLIFHQYFGMEESNASIIVDSITKEWLGTIGGLLAVLGVIAAPITSGDTALRSARLIVADFMHLEQKSIAKRLLICIPIFAVTIGQGVDAWMPDGALKDLLVDGVIGGVGSVIVFLPNIMILYLFIAFMEDSGYLARAAFIMDRIMHRIGLHGKSFIPLIMGFGCNVPAIMATRTIESRSSRLITVLLVPFMSCSARIPIYILLIGTFFAAYASWVMLGLYLLGIVVAVITARLMRRYLFKKDETPFVMELPPYRVPTMRATLSHMWDRCAQYLRKMGGLILVASVAVWFLSYYPTPDAAAPAETTEEHYENSYLGQVGQACSPVFEPLGLNWKASIAILTGLPAKEIVVSTLGVLYSEQGDAPEAELDSPALSQRLVASGDFTPASALAFLVFILLYLPCIATIVAIAAEIGWRWACISVLYNTALAWIMAYLTYHLFSWL